MITRQDFHLSFDSEMDKVYTEDAPSFPLAFKDYLINDAMRTFVKTYYASGVEKTEKNRQALQTIVNTVEIPVSGFINTWDNSYAFPQPEDLWEILRIEAVGYDSKCKRDRELFLYEYQNDDFSYIKGDPFKRPEGRYAQYTVQKDIIRLSVGKTIEPKLVYLIYLQKFVEINSTQTVSTFPEQFKEEIVRIAANKALELIQSNRVQSYMAINGIVMA